MSLTKQGILRRNRQQGLLTGQDDIQLEVPRSNSPNPVIQYREVYTQSLDMIGELNKYKKHYIELFGHVELLPKEPDISVIYNEIKACLPEKEECSIIRLKKMKGIVEVYIKYINSVDYIYKGLVKKQGNLKKKYPYLVSFERINHLWSKGFKENPLDDKLSSSKDRVEIVQTWAYFTNLGETTKLDEILMGYTKLGSFNVSNFAYFSLGRTLDEKKEYLNKLSVMYCKIPRTNTIKYPAAGLRRQSRNKDHNKINSPRPFIECSDSSFIPFSKDDPTSGATKCDGSLADNFRKQRTFCNSIGEWILVL